LAAFDVTPEVTRRLQDVSIIGYSFHSFSYSLQFRRKWYHWYQSQALLRDLKSQS
jgi:hypothetical protein